MKKEMKKKVKEWIAFKNINSFEIIAEGSTALEASIEAEKRGYSGAVIVHCSLHKFI
jgi:hypothetical protein